MTAATGNESAAGIKSGKGQNEEKICIFGIVHLLGGWRSVWFGVVVGRLVVLLYTHLFNYYFLIVF